MFSHFTLPYTVALRLLALCMTAAFMCPASSQAQEDEDKAAAVRQQFTSSPVLVEADTLNYDDKERIVSAEGSVEVVQDKRILRAEKLTYYEAQNLVVASGNVSVLEPDGNVFFAEEVELTDDLQQGIIKELRARLIDDSMFAASQAERVSEDVMVFDNAVYSPCKTCDNGEGKEPFWQIKARKVTYDKAEQSISYKHARFEVKGVPIAYTPYLSHVAPGADRKSGLLAPEYRNSSLLGTVIEAPVYVNVAPQADATLTPIYTTKEGWIMRAQTRHLTENGAYELDGSITRPDKRDANGLAADGAETRGHISGRGNFAINDTWKWGFDASRATDKTYLRRYDFSNEDTLTSRLFLEGMGDEAYDRTYALVEGISFQGLNPEDEQDTTPLIMPLMQFQHDTTPGWMGSWFQFDSNLLSLTRHEGSEMQRGSVTADWILPWQTNGGHLFTLRTSLRNDIYYTSNVTSETGNVTDETSIRSIPEMALQWRYPLAGDVGSLPVVIEPVAEIIVSPDNGNPDDIPNLDSQVFEFADSNLFSSNRHAGYDRVEHGTRANYGVRSTVELNDNRYIEVLMGQSYHANDENNYPFTDEPGSHASDYVGHVTLEDEKLFLQYRFRFDQEDMSSRSTAITSLLRLHPIYMNIDYIALENDPNLGNIEEIFAGASWVVNDSWTLSAGGRRDLEDSRMIDARAGVTYHNECITVVTQLGREFTRFRDLEPSTTARLQISLKNLN